MRDQDYSLFQRAFALGLLGRSQKKISSLERLISQYTESPYIDDAYFEMGRSYMSMEQQQEAIQYFSRLVEEYSSSSYTKQALVQLGLIHYNLNNNDKALRFYKRVVDHYPGTEEAKDALTGIKNIYVDMNRVNDYFNYVNGLGDFARVSISEQDSLTYIAAEKIYMEENCENAIEFFRKYLRKFPNGSFNVNAHFYLADCFHRRGDTGQALEHYNQVIDHTRNNFSEEALSGAARINMQQENYVAALEQLGQLEKIAEVQRNLVFSRVGQMNAAFRIQKYGDAFEMADKVLHTDKVNAREKRDAHFVRAKVFFRREHYDKALDAFRIIADEVNSPQGAEAKYRIAQIYYKQEEYKVAENEIFDFVQQNSSQEYWKARSFVLLADVYQAMGDLFQARHTLKSILENYQPVNEQDDVLTIAEKKYQKIQKEGEEQTRPDTSEKEMKIRLKENLPDTTDNRNNNADPAKHSEPNDAVGQEDETAHPAGDSGSDEPTGQNDDNETSSESTSKNTNDE